jgi:surface antigen
MNLKVTSILVISTVLLSACSTMSKEQAGGAGGAVLGGAAGAAACRNMGKGDGNTAMIAGCTLLGATAGYFVGGAVGSSLDKADLAATSRALETASDNQPVSWQNPNTGNQYTVTPTATYQTANNVNCREYSTEAIINGSRETVHGKACRQPDGSWKEVE